ncbi:MAG: glycosyltransferase family 2 protein [Saprospiraceae bacterium]|nr:glycosyltransferase family 2 protein [Candidatus Vicinibacter affinis]MBP6173928.1 glycosyltransferase family 2 protein [Saprospiraceae bacterium]MBK6573041.1 glycosyltransferase family 2 protein [Candidatus Vicinibacter affinis]MBK6822497.1 glycosyltransferase family 2 protein [Candidatus Vicinibacter affinis]MBK7692861.1 glycosyltransferase family 2 protein [Candidatus Vicinibacter affinis]
MSDNHPYLSIIIPCYNEDSVLVETYQRLVRSLNHLNFSFEIIFINDGSTDQTPFILDDFANKDERVLVLHFSRNFGHQQALTAGLHECKGQFAVIMDADLQDPPEIIPEMLKLATRESANIVYGQRVTRKKEGWFKKTSASCYYRILNFLSDVELPLDSGDFRLIDRVVINAFKELKEKNKYIRGLMSWVGFKQIPFAYEREARSAGNTHYTLGKMVQLATKGLLYFSKKPLMIAMNIGFISVLVGLLLAIYVLISKFVYHEAVTGWSSILISVIFFGGIQLLSIGILGQYLGSIFEEVKNRPEYLISRRVRQSFQSEK